MINIYNKKIFFLCNIMKIKRTYNISRSLELKKFKNRGSLTFILNTDLGFYSLFWKHIRPFIKIFFKFHSNFLSIFIRRLCDILQTITDLQLKILIY